MRILLIEPNTVLGRLYQIALTRAGHQVRFSQSAHAAVSVIDQTKPDLIILEIELPRHSGVEFLYELRSYPDWQDIAVLIHSFRQESELSISSSLKNLLGISGYLYKAQTSLGQLIDEVASFEPARQ